MPRGSDKSFLEKAEINHVSNRVYKKVLKQKNSFIINHYAGEVVYDTRGFLEKNRDTLTTDLFELLFSSESSFINELFPQNNVRVFSAISNFVEMVFCCGTLCIDRTICTHILQATTDDKKSSLSKQFQGQLNLLMQTLNRTEPHYIRCIKPNEHKCAGVMVTQNCMEQLKYSGVFEAVAIRKQGYPFRLE